MFCLPAVTEPLITVAPEHGVVTEGGIRNNLTDTLITLTPE